MLSKSAIGCSLNNSTLDVDENGSLAARISERAEVEVEAGRRLARVAEEQPKAVAVREVGLAEAALPIARL